MDPVQVFSERDLQLHPGKLLDEAEAGRLALITKHGRPAILAVPFNGRLLQHGVHRAIALDLFEQGQVNQRGVEPFHGYGAAPARFSKLYEAAAKWADFAGDRGGIDARLAA